MAAQLGRRGAVISALLTSAFGPAVTAPAGAAASRTAALGSPGVAVGAIMPVRAGQAIGPRASEVIAERTMHALVEVLERDLGATGVPGGVAGIEALRARIRQQVADDFTVGRIVKVDGWRLSLTEARLCALIACAGEDCRLGIN